MIVNSFGFINGFTCQWALNFGQLQVKRGNWLFFDFMQNHMDADRNVYLLAGLHKHLQRNPRQFIGTDHGIVIV
jgi:hypothetical protein